MYSPSYAVVREFGIVAIFSHEEDAKTFIAVKPSLAGLSIVALTQGEMGQMIDLRTAIKVRVICDNCR